MKARILKYLNEEMTQEEGSFFEHELKRDHLMYLIEKYDVLETGAQKKTKPFSFRQKILMAAGFVLLIGLSVIYSSKYSGNLNDKIFASYYHPYNINYNTRVYYTKNNMNDALNLYNTGNYQDVIIKLQAVIKTDTSNINAYFLLGVSLMEKQKYGEAIKIFTRIGENNFSEPIEWYLALCYLKTKQTNKAVPLLNSLANKYYYQSKAEDILNKLGK